MEEVSVARPLGKMMVEIDLDKGVQNVGFSDPETIKLMQPIEIMNIFSPFHAACIVNELRRRRDGQALIVPASPKIIIELNDKINRQ
jgi:hypothetical protein